jgi:hypothetical protein
LSFDLFTQSTPGAFPVRTTHLCLCGREQNDVALQQVNEIGANFT